MNEFSFSLSRHLALSLSLCLYQHQRYSLITYNVMFDTHHPQQSQSVIVMQHLIPNTVFYMHRNRVYGLCASLHDIKFNVPSIFPLISGERVVFFVSLLFVLMMFHIFFRFRLVFFFHLNFSFFLRFESIGCYLTG